MKLNAQKGKHKSLDAFGSIINKDRKRCHIKKRQVCKNKKGEMVYSFHFIYHQNELFAQSRIDMPSIITGGLKMQENMCKVKSLI